LGNVFLGWGEAQAQAEAAGGRVSRLAGVGGSVIMALVSPHAAHFHDHEDFPRMRRKSLPDHGRETVFGFGLPSSGITFPMITKRWHGFWNLFASTPFVT
jgi:hypothetical protein